MTPTGGLQLAPLQSVLGSGVGSSSAVRPKCPILTFGKEPAGTEGGEGPVGGSFDEACTEDWIAVDVADGVPKVLVVANHPVKVVSRPEPTFSLQSKIDTARATTFPPPHDFSQRCFLVLPDQNMNMIRHHAPKDEAVSDLMPFE